MPKMLAAGSIPDSIRALRFAIAGSILLGACCGCSQFGPACSTGDDANPPEIYTGGTIVDRQYMSSPWAGPLLWFPGGKRYDLIHSLGCIPREVAVWEAFSENGTSTGAIAPAAGNMSLVQSVDATKIRIKNDTCSDFFVLVTATAPECGDAGIDAAADAAQDVAAQ